MLMIDVRIALKSLRATRIRTALTILGIVIGVASITSVLSISEGAKNTVSNEVRRMGDDVLTVRSGKGTRDGRGNLTDYNYWAALGATTISEYDLKAVQDTPGVRIASPVMAITGSARATPDSEPVKNANIIATNVDFAQVAGLKTHSGEFLNDASSRNTVVLGQDLAVQMLGSDTAIGNSIYLRGELFTVVGVLNKYNVPANFGNLYDYNKTAFVPMDAGKAFNQGVAQIQQINLRVVDSSQIKSVASQLQTTLLKNHGGEEDFVVLRPEETLALTNNMLQMVAQFSSAIASISLVVGGVGIMNIMLVSVTERTREIGIRKAVGATSAQVLRQFLIEALVMSLAGGLIGVALAYISALAIGSFFGVLPAVTWQIFGIALAVALSVGIIFGIAPALKAARKNPIEALRFFQ
jgi:putative ABC transport system permease protein